MLRPRIKAVFPPIPIGGGKIRLGDINPGVAAELDDDEQGHTWHLLTLLDGASTRAEIAEEMRSFDPQVPVDDVETAIDELASAGFLEDAEVGPPEDVFSAEELERYRRNFDFFAYFPQPPRTDYEVQESLKRAHVAIFGVGGLGSHVAMSLAALGVGRLTLIDYDIVEYKNLNRQLLYTGEDVGELKTAAATRRLAQINPHVRVSAHKSLIDGAERVAGYLDGVDLAICAVDQPWQIYEWFNKAALDERVAWIRAGTSGRVLAAALHVPFETPCFTCAQVDDDTEQSWISAFNSYMIEHQADRRLADRRTVNPCSAPTAGMLGNVVALEAFKFLTGAASPAILGRRLIFDLGAMEISYAGGERRGDCPACGEPQAQS
jgi:molybdopterin/thiamine biosynthesis adenylyltransferase